MALLLKHDDTPGITVLTKKSAILPVVIVSAFHLLNADTW